MIHACSLYFSMYSGACVKYFVINFKSLTANMKKMNSYEFQVAGISVLITVSSFRQFSLSVMSGSFWPMDGNTPGFSVHHQLPELAQTHVHQVGNAIQPSHPVVPLSSCPQSFPASGSFPMSQLFTSRGQSTGVSASASVLPVNIQDWFPLGWTGWISLQSKGRSRVFSNTTVQKHKFFGA